MLTLLCETIQEKQNRKRQERQRHQLQARFQLAVKKKKCSLGSCIYAMLLFEPKRQRQET